ncbi:hypothetical protein, partial [Burkholderia pseudomallei]|uniref:hypothetical protein n=1 Tax=Burkholderia pseudomallei TaxID=28450 RepID=UPI001AAE69E7
CIYIRRGRPFIERAPGRFTPSRKADHGVFPDAYHRLGIYKIERWLNFEKKCPAGEGTLDKSVLNNKT